MAYGNSISLGVFRMALGVGVDEAGSIFWWHARARRLVSNLMRLVGRWAAQRKRTASIRSFTGRYGPDTANRRKQHALIDFDVMARVRQHQKTGRPTTGVLLGGAFWVLLLLLSDVVRGSHFGVGGNWV